MVGEVEGWNPEHDVGEGLALAESPKSCCRGAQVNSGWEQNCAELASEMPGASHTGQPRKTPGPLRLPNPSIPLTFKDRLPTIENK